MSDDQLMGALHAGVEDALAVLFDRYHRLVRSVARKIVRDPGEAEDVMQTVFLEIFRAVGQFDPGKGTTKVWILQYAYHRAINRKRHLNARNFYSQVDVDESQPVSPSGETGYTHDELKRLLEEGLAMLNASQRQVIELASYYGLSMKEIADHTSDSVSNVRHRYYRGLQKLRTFIVGQTGKVVNAVAAVKQIDSVFVTVEPAGGAKKPSGQHLYAYLGDANHPSLAAQIPPLIP